MDECEQRDKLPKALEALDNIKEEYRRFYDESMDETRSFDSGMRSLLYNIEQVGCLVPVFTSSTNLEKEITGMSLRTFLHCTI